jgi:hypothetical protein
MIVPQYWAEGRVQHRQAGRQVTVRRFGWSDASLTEAQRHADERAQAALQRLLAGEKLERREPKRPYNGAQGVPIREEIVDRQGDTIVTRNSYGARCLNTPNVLFADIDFDSRPGFRFGLVAFAVLLALGGAAGWLVASWLLAIVLMLASLLLGYGITQAVHRIVQRAQGGEERLARKRISRFLAEHPAWNLRLYRTPAGLRVMATHQTFSPNDPAVLDCFKALGTDPIYIAMCLNQQCFRARVSAKPWRIGIGEHMRPRPGVWPVAPDRLPARSAWIARYEDAAQSFAACALLEEMGSGATHPDVKAVQAWHDTLCSAARQLPLA